MPVEAITRLAPSPTGALHLGNARTFFINWVLARQNGWRVLLRIDDLEGPRIKPGADQQAIADLKWLGLDWDSPPLWQSKRVSAYERAQQLLLGRNLLYPCTCTRTEISAAAGGREELDHSTFYPGTCRSRYRSLDDARSSAGRPAALRFIVPQREICFEDDLLGRQCFGAGRDFGDFVVRKSDGEWGYHLANVVDDAEMNVTHVVRGEDLLASAPRQILIYEALGLESRIPHYTHLPLIVGLDGRKLAKRHGDTRLAQLREEGVSAEQVRGLLATWSGLDSRSEGGSIEFWLKHFSLDRVPRQRVTYDDARHRPRSCKPRGGA